MDRREFLAAMAALPCMGEPDTRSIPGDRTSRNTRVVSRLAVVAYAALVLSASLAAPRGAAADPTIATGGAGGTYPPATNFAGVSINGIESDINYLHGGLSLTAAAAYTDAKTKGNICAVAADKTPDAEGFVTIFDGKSLDGWKKATENPDSFQLKDGAIVANGEVRRDLLE